MNSYEKTAVVALVITALTWGVAVCTIIFLTLG